MFRRKEDSLFDNTTDPNQDSEETAATGAASSQGSSYQGSGSASYGQSMPRPPGSQPTGGFRAAPSAPGTSDLGRNRMPEVGGNKPHSPVMPVSSGPIPSPIAVTPMENKSSSPLPSAPKTAKAGQRVLTVGNDILLKGEIATCDRLVIEGKVDATLNDVHTVEIAEGGSFKGSASIEDAEISGLFEGDLIVRNRLVIYSTGRVRGSITYGEIEIERGGELTGEIKNNASKASPSLRPAHKNSKEAA